MSKFCFPWGSPNQLGKSPRFSFNSLLKSCIHGFVQWIQTEGLFENWDTIFSVLTLKIFPWSSKPCRFVRYDSQWAMLVKKQKNPEIVCCSARIQQISRHGACAYQHPTLWNSTLFHSFLTFQTLLVSKTIIGFPPIVFPSFQHKYLVSIANTFFPRTSYLPFRFILVTNS